jgi:hypothetical protein
MLLIPRGRDPTEKQISAIEEIMRAVLGFDKDVNERLSQARFIAGCAQSFAQAAGLFAELFNKRLTEQERRELIDIVEEIHESTGRPPYRRESRASQGARWPRTVLNGSAGFVDWRSRRRAVAMAPPSLVLAFSRTRHASSRHATIRVLGRHLLEVC